MIIAKILAKVKICAVYSRPVFRAHETAKILASPHDLKIKTLEELTEAKIKPEYVFKEISPFHNCYKSGKLVPAWTSNWPLAEKVFISFASLPLHRTRIVKHRNLLSIISYLYSQKCLRQ